MHDDERLLRERVQKFLQSRYVKTSSTIMRYHGQRLIGPDDDARYVTDSGISDDPLGRIDVGNRYGRATCAPESGMNAVQHGYRRGFTVAPEC